MNIIKSLKLERYLSIVIPIIILASVSIYSQPELRNDDIAKINVMTDKLVKKILLTQKQEDSINKILVEFFKGLHNTSGNGKKLEELRTIAEGKILKNLDNKQKMKFEIVKDDWWDIIN